MEQRKLDNITSLRGIAAVFIIVHHYSTYLIPEIKQFTSGFTPFISKNYIWVDFFFILSGFILAYVYSSKFQVRVEKKDYLKYISSRFARIYPLHLFILIAFLFLESAEYIHFQAASAAGDSQHQYLPFTGTESIPTFIINLFLLQTFINGTYWNQPAWSISAEWVVYMFIPLLVPVICRFKWPGKATLFLLSFSVLYILQKPHSTLDLTPTLSFIRCICEAIIGIALYDIYKSNLWSNILSGNNATHLIFSASFLTLFLDISHLITIAIFALLILSAAYNIDDSFLSNKFLIFLGTISYSIYMTHWFIQVLLQKLSKVITGNDFSDNFSSALSPAVLLICICLVIVASTITYKLIENPFRKWLRSISV
ncbi:MAG: acyltransferase [Gammaproteobacteria bacterium]|nr:acyltransferase [Gammaproteobacteria bacterium]